MYQRNQLKAVDLAQISMFAAIIAVCSWISIPATVPFTLQTFGVFLAVGVLGGKRGTIAVLTYLFMGIIGLPVFAGFGGGIGYLMGSTGGYIFGFLFSALVMWSVEGIFGRTNRIFLVSMILGLFVCYGFGTVWFLAVYANAGGMVTLGMVLSWCVLPYAAPDVMKILLALWMRKRLARICSIN